MRSEAPDRLPERRVALQRRHDVAYLAVRGDYPHIAEPAGVQPLAKRQGVLPWVCVRPARERVRERERERVRE